MAEQILVSFRIDVQQLESIDRLVGARRTSGDTGTTRSAVIREAIDAYVEPYGEILAGEAGRMKAKLRRAGKP